MSIRDDSHSNKAARILYWVSMLLLVAGGRVLIYPEAHPAGQTVHIYITLVAFELYMWLLMLLGRWQAGKVLEHDVARSGIFVAILQGLQFMALHELHMAAPGQGLICAFVAVALAVVKLPLAGSWLKVALPKPFMSMAVAWIVVMAAPGPILAAFQPHPSLQVAVGYVACWVTAMVIAAHLPLVVWQRARGFGESFSILARWYVPWVISAIMGSMALIQLYAGRWGMFVDWGHWFFSGIWLAVGVVVLSLSLVCRARYQLAGLIFGAGVLHAILAWLHGSTSNLPFTWTHGMLSWLMHPGYTAGVFGCVLLATSGQLLQMRWLKYVAILPPALFGLAKLKTLVLEPVGRTVTDVADAVDRWPYSKGVLLLLAAFACLGAGAAIQWYRQKYPPTPRRTPIPVSPELEEALQKLTEAEHPTEENKPNDSPQGSA